MFISFAIESILCFAPSFLKSCFTLLRTNVSASLHEMTQNKMGEDAERDFAIPFVDENDYSEISAKAVSAKRKLKKNRPSSLV